MYKKCMYLIFLVLILTIAGNTLAVDRNWTNGNGNRLWTTAANWSGSVVPTSADKAAIRNTAISGPIINTGMAAVASQIVVGDWSSTNDTLNMTGGTLTASSWFTLGYSAGNKGTLTLSGGTITANTTLYIGRAGNGILNMTGGTINVTSGLAIAQTAGGSGDIHLDGGTISCGTFTMATGSTMNVTAGTLIVNGDVTSTINTYRTNGWITAYGGSGTLNVSYNTPNAGKTTVTATSGGPPSAATNPNPANGATGIGTTTDISWTAGSGATSHDVYFGTTSPGTFRGNQAGTTYDTGTMANNTTYYWRIDEKNANGTTTGTVWSFTTAAAPTLPGKATTPNPANGATGISTTNDLSWAAGSGATSHDVYFGTTSPGTLRGNQAGTTYDTGTMTNNTTYYWRIDEKNAAGTTTGDVWSFTTAVVAGVDRNWTNGAGTRAWGTAANWSGSVVPTSADKAAVRNTAVSGPIIAAGTNAVANTVVVGDWSSTNDTLNMTGGTLTVGDWFVLAYGPTANHGTFTMTAGTVNVGTFMYVGNSGTSVGVLDISGGTITIATTLGIAQVAGSTGDVFLDGGTISCGSLNMTSGGGLDITAGTLIVNGDVTTLINTYRTNGWITAYGGAGTVNVSYNTPNAGKTTVTATPSTNPPGKATGPSPANGATAVGITTDLNWTAGSGATSHDVYFGTTSPGTLRGNQTSTTYDTGTMANSTTYYWRIDAKNAYGTTTGDVWSFTTAASTPANRRKGPYLLYPGNNTQMTVLWQIDVTTGCNIAWGTSTSYSSGSAGTTEYGTDHQHKYNITGLTPGTRYYYRVTIGSNNYTGNFYAAPASTATAVKFFMYGDTRTNGSSNNTVCGQMVSAYNADAAFQTMVLHAGDWVNANAETNWTSEWFNYSWTNIVNTTANMPFQGTIGNHESSGTIFEKYHPYAFVAAPADYFSFDYGPVHVAVVDQYTSYTSGSAQYNWLNTDLTNSTKLWKIIVLHQPGWSCNGGHANDGTVQSTIQPLCVSKGVSIVLGGHNHYYSRAVVSGVHHITAGGGGAPLYTPASGQPNIVTYTKSLAVSKVVISGNTLTCTTVNGSGSVIDTFTVTK